MDLVSQVVAFIGRLFHMGEQEEMLLQSDMQQLASAIGATNSTFDTLFNTP